ncbi:MAG: hypothetical protein M2R45_00061 [Verrucomicrobia subdivision 3 bacterium]|nr:hypothetical protein [Limisphaerales bacterium]MCS1412480.1 hypothetical protein [Limisphaerales bacterium]
MFTVATQSLLDRRHGVMVRRQGNDLRATGVDVIIGKAARDYLKPDASIMDATPTRAGRDQQLRINFFSDANTAVDISVLSLAKRKTDGKETVVVVHIVPLAIQECDFSKTSAVPSVSCFR